MKFLLFLSLAVVGVSAHSQSTQRLLKQADSLETSLQELAAFNKYREVLKLDPRNYTALWKCSELCSRIGNRQQKKESRLGYFRAAINYAENAIRSNPHGADGYYVLSVAMGRKALIESGSDKVKAVRDIKSNAERAIAIDPAHGRAWHVMGKWHYEVSDLNSLEKGALKLFFGGLPKASLKDAIKAYEKAKALEPMFALNNLELAKAYHRDGQTQRALSLLRDLPSIPNKTEDDPRIKAEGKQLYQKWSK